MDGNPSPYGDDLMTRRVLRVRHPNADPDEYPGSYQVSLRGAPGSEVIELPFNWHVDSSFLAPLVSAVSFTLRHHDGLFPPAGAITARLLYDLQHGGDVHPPTAEFYRRLAQAFDTIVVAGAHPTGMWNIAPPPVRRVLDAGTARDSHGEHLPQDVVAAPDARHVGARHAGRKDKRRPYCCELRLCRPPTCQQNR